ncbi:winged helix-turn-helix transcriptional regulator [Streptomyces sp. NPDC054796]
MTIELLRNLWTFPVLVAIREAAMRPTEILHHINEGNARNADLTTRVLHEKTLHATLSRMEREKMIRRHPWPAAANIAAPWASTQMSTELLCALDSVGGWADQHRDQLVRQLMRHRGTAPREPEFTMINQRNREQEYWRGIGVALEILRLRWSFSIIAALRHGPQRPSDLVAEINGGIKRNRDITGGRTLSEKMLWDTLHRLVDGGLILHESRTPQFASSARSTLTSTGSDLFSALAPVGEWGGRYQRHLAEVIRIRRSLTPPHESDL